MGELKQRRKQRPTSEAGTTLANKDGKSSNSRTTRDNNKKKKRMPIWMVIILFILYFVALSVVNPITIPNIFYLLKTRSYNSSCSDSGTSCSVIEKKENHTCGPVHTDRVIFVRVPKTATTTLLSIFMKQSQKTKVARVDLEELEDLISSIPLPGVKYKMGYHDASLQATKSRLKQYYKNAARNIVYPPMLGQERTLYDGHLFLFNFTKNAMTLVGPEPYWMTLLPDWWLALYNRQRPIPQDLERVYQITLLRNPQDRLASMYYYDRHEARNNAWRNQFVQQRGNVTLEQCLLDEQCVQVNELRRYCSLQVEMLCGLSPACARPVSRASLDLAKQHVNSSSGLLLFAGITERMEENLQLLSQLLPTYLDGVSLEEDLLYNNIPREKQSPVTRRERVFSKRAQKVLDDICSLDNELYAYVNQLLTERLKKCTS